MFNYYCLNDISKVGTDLFSTNYKNCETLEEADAILVRSFKMQDMELSSKLSVVARAGAGVNNIPLDACAQKGIVVFNTPGANANAVKELVLAGMLYASRDVIGGIEWCREHADDVDVSTKVEKAKKEFAGHEVIGKKLGVIGLGAIGSLVANAALNLGMDVYGYDPFISVNAAWNISSQVKHVTDLNEIFRNCDYITLHVPLLDSTKNTINKEAIEMMKDGVVILNFARDILCDEEEVLKALDCGKVKYYVTDFPNETVLKSKRTIVTPHLGASTEEAEDNCAAMAVREVMDYLENGNITHSVNYPDTNMGVCTSVGRIAILHKNVAGMISKYTNIFTLEGVNIAGMANKSKGDYAYSLFDLDSEISADTLAKLEALDDVFKVRKVK